MSEQESRPTVVVVALPAADDPIHAASSEQPSAHMTLVFLGDVDADAGTVGIDVLAAAVEEWAGRIDGPITEGVAGSAVLGPDKAQVVLVDASAFVDIRNGMAAADSGPIGDVAGHVTQYPVWTPHVTLGYPDAPPLAEYAGESITFDRLALWAGDDYREFPLGGSAQPVEEPVESVTAAGPDDTLLGEESPAPPVDERDPADTPEGDDDEDEFDAEPIPFHGIAAPTGTMSDDGRMFARLGLAWRKLPLSLTYQVESAPGHFKSVVVGRIDEMWYDEHDRIQYAGVFASPTAQPWVDQVVAGIAEGWLRGVSVDVVAGVVGEDFQNEQQVLDATNAGEHLREIMTSGKVAGLCVVPLQAFADTYIALGECDCPDEVAEDTDEVPADDELEELVASALGAMRGDRPATDEVEAFHEGLVALVQADTEVQSFAAQVPWNETHPEGSEEAHREWVDAVVAAAFAPGTKDGPGWVTHPKATNRIRDYWVRGKGAAKIRWGAPNDFYRCRRQLAKYIKNPSYLSGTCSNMHKEALGVWPGQEDGGKRGGIIRKALRASAGAELTPAPAWTLVASAAVDGIPDGAWFEDPKLTKPTPLTVTADGRVFGHVAVWGTCHIGFSGKCVEPPRNHSGYAYFRTGTVQTTKGDVRVGHLTVGTGHADVRQRALAAAAHYDNTGTAAADVAAGDDGIGIWVAGWVRPGTTPEQVYALRAAALSGDWRKLGGRMEMVAALAVNVPGFPIVETLTASAVEYEGDEAIIAAGIVEQPAEALERLAESAPTPELRAIVAAAVARALDVDRAFSALNDIVREARADEVRAAFAIINEEV